MSESEIQLSCVKKPTLLIVDDEEKNLHSMSRLLEGMDIELVLVSSGQQALRELLYHDFFLVLMDVQMPDMNGFETAQLILESKNTAHLPIVFITAISKNEYFVSEGYNVGAVDYLYKPVNIDVLCSKVNVFKELWLQTQKLLSKNDELSHLNKKLEEMSQALSRSNEELSHMALHDALTGLSNRVHFNKNLEMALERSRRKSKTLAIFFIDLDDFKTINDTLGHDAGDELLILISRRLEMSVRTSDLVCRFGGDEFAVLAEDIDHSLSASSIAQHMLDVIGIEIDLQGYKQHISLSIGIALYPESDVGAHELMRYADMAMYKAKRAGKSGYSYYSDILQDMASEEIQGLALLTTALKETQFEVFFHPEYALQKDAQSNQIIGVEAIVRWRHPERGLIPSDDFFPLAERLGLMKDIGEWLLIELCLLMNKWQQAKLIDSESFRVSMPLSSRQIHQSGLLESMDAILKEHNISPSLLELDVSEETLLDDLVYCADVLQRAKKMGMHVAINDFGSGLMSLNHLQQLPIETLKIDERLSADIVGSVKNRNIVLALMHMAKALNLSLIAEGIDENQQIQDLKDIDCDVLLGYLPTQQVSASQFESTLSARKNH